MIYVDGAVIRQQDREYIEPDGAPIPIAPQPSATVREIIRAARPPRIRPAAPAAQTPGQSGAGAGITVNAPKAPETQRRADTVATPVPAAGVAPRMAAGLSAAPVAGTDAATAARIVLAVIVVSLVIVILGIAEDD